ncbi:hypothetical protein AB1Y20_008843 [Prymnesium parvum]|uniref:Uncharacterized protein n=1 Tax=Prymnesium parvum TaxID=97485 RepID=A0AB34ITI2_PRYPA
MGPGEAYLLPASLLRRVAPPGAPGGACPPSLCATESASDVRLRDLPDRGFECLLAGGMLLITQVERRPSAGHTLVFIYSLIGLLGCGKELATRCLGSRYNKQVPGN